MTPLKFNTNPRKYYPPMKDDAMVLSLLHNIYKNVHSLKFNYLAMMTGKHRVGKSISTCWFSHLLDKTFWNDFENRVVYTAEQFMEALESLRKKKIIGGAVVWDEAGVGIPSREWYKMSNRAINYAIQVFGYLRPIIFFVTQDMTYIDSQPRKLFHNFFVARRATVSYNIVTPYDVSYDKKTGKIYYYHPRFKQRLPNGAYSKKYVLDSIILPRPPAKFIERYDKHSEPWKDEIMQRMRKETETVKADYVTFQNMTDRERGKWLAENYEDFPILMSKRSKPNNPLFDVDMVASHMGIPVRKAKIACKFASDILLQKIMEESKGNGDNPPPSYETGIIDPSQYEEV